MLQNVDILKQCQRGRIEAERLIEEIDNFNSNNCDFLEMVSSGVTMIKPFGKSKVGVKSANISWSLADIDDEVKLLP